MKALIYTLFILSYGSAFAQLSFSTLEITSPELKPDRYTGVVIEQYSDGRPKLWRQEKEGKADGLWQEWYPNGSLRYRAWWKNGLGHGKWEYFYANGQLRSESFYIGDIAQGMYISYHENGQIARKAVYIDGKLDGFAIDYDENGTPRLRQRYQQGELRIEEPMLFEPGLIATETANEWDITFTPDNLTAYFTRRLTDGSAQKIYTTTKDENGDWLEPVIASFSTDRDEGAFISPDGNSFYFGSTRPLFEEFSVQNLDMNIWMMNKTETGWSEPQPLSKSINKERRLDDEWPLNYETGPSIDNAGKLYYWTKSTTNRSSNLYTSTMKRNGTFNEPAELLPPSHNQGFDSGPVISPDGTMLFFVSSNRAESYGGEDLYYSKLTDGEWSKPGNLGPVVNSVFNEAAPRFSADGKYFFFSSDRANVFDADGERIWSIYYMETQFLMVE